MIRTRMCKCGNDSYLKGWFGRMPVWKCANCNKLTERIIRKITEYHKFMLKSSTCKNFTEE